jgi:NAD(P)-dependent dehydrogenase (short-subunit alcohol dehydrogenase family)
VQKGATVLVADVDETGGAAVALECGAEFVRLDVSSEQAWSALAEKVRADYGHLDVMINNAGIVSNADIMTVDVATWNQLLSINLTGMMLGCQTAIALMRDNPAGAQGVYRQYGVVHLLFGDPRRRLHHVEGRRSGAH